MENHFKNLPLEYVFLTNVLESVEMIFFVNYCWSIDGVSPVWLGQCLEYISFHREKKPFLHYVSFECYV